MNASVSADVQRPEDRESKKFATVWWYDFTFAGKRIRESAKTTLKTLARMAEQKRRRELEEGFNGLADKRDERIRTIKELADEYLAEYKLRHKSVTFAEYALGNVTRHLGEHMAVEVAEKTVKEYQSDRLQGEGRTQDDQRRGGFPVTVVGRSGRRHQSKTEAAKGPETRDRQAGRQGVHSRGEGAALGCGEGRTVTGDLSGPHAGIARGNAGCRNPHDAVGQAGSVEGVPHGWRQQDRGGRGPDHSAELGLARSAGGVLEVVHPTIRDDSTGLVRVRLREALAERSDPSDGDAEDRLGTTSKRKANVTGPMARQPAHVHYRSGRIGEAGDETIRDMAGHVSKQMLKHYSHIGMEAKRRAGRIAGSEEGDTATGGTQTAAPETAMAKILKGRAKDSTKVDQINLGMRA